MAKWPDLVPVRLCKTPIHVEIDAEGWDRDGAPVKAFIGDLLCNFQDGGQTAVNSEQEYIRTRGSAYFHGDPFPEIANITGGWVKVFEEERKIEQGIKGRNPDGTVNFVQLRLL